MKTRAIASLVIKLMALYVLFQSIVSIPVVLSTAFISVSNAGELWRALLTTVVGLSFPAICAVAVFLVIRFADRIASLIANDDDSLDPGTAPDTAAVMRIVITAIGVLQLAKAVPRLTQLAASWSFLRQQSQAVSSSFGYQVLSQFIGTALHVVLAVWLVSRPRQVQGLIAKLQEGDTDETTA